MNILSIKKVKQRNKLINPKHRPLFSRAGKIAKLSQVFDRFATHPRKENNHAARIPSIKNQAMTMSSFFKSSKNRHSDDNIQESKNIEEMSYNGNGIFNILSQIEIENKRKREKIKKLRSEKRTKLISLTKIPDLDKKKEKSFRFRSLNKVKSRRTRASYTYSHSNQRKPSHSQTTKNSLSKGTEPGKMSEQRRKRNKFRTLNQKLMSLDNRLLNKSENFLKESLNCELFSGFEKYKLRKVGIVKELMTKKKYEKNKVVNFWKDAEKIQKRVLNKTPVLRRRKLDVKGKTGYMGYLRKFSSSVPAIGR
jgi:hypothetical protein